MAGTDRDDEPTCWTADPRAMTPGACRWRRLGTYEPYCTRNTMARCRSCRAPIVWMKTEGGKNIPIDAEDMGGWEAPNPVPNGNLNPVEGKTGVVRYVEAGKGKWQSHFVTCPEREDWRRK